MRSWLLGIALLGYLGCGGSDGNTNTFEVETVPSVSDVTLRFTEPLPADVDTIRISGFAEPPGEHDHAHRQEPIQAAEEHEHEEDLVLVFGPESRAAAAELVFSDVPTHVIELDIELLESGVVHATGHVEVSLTPNGNFIVEDPPLEEEHDHDEE